MRSMLRSVVTLTKVTLLFLNIWVLAVLLVVSLGHWRVFDSSDSRPGYNPAHLVVMRELKEEADGRIGPRPSIRTNESVPHIIALVADVQSTAAPPAPSQELAPKKVSRQNESRRVLSAIPGGHLPPVVDSRAATLRYWCQKQHPQKTPYEKIPKEKLNSILVDEHHRLLFCQIPGVAINEWRKIMLILNRGVNASRVDDIAGGDVYSKYAKLPKRLDEFGDKKRGEMLKNYLKVVFVRDPLERLVISYRTKLLSKGAKYFHRTFGSLIIKKYRKKASAAEVKEGTNVKFSEFVKFIIDNEHTGAGSLNEHWEQYYKQCHPCLVNYDFVGTFEAVEKDTKAVIDKLQASRSIQPPYITDTKTLSQKELAKVYSQVTANEVSNLFKIFSADYTLFGYQCPSFVHDLLSKGNIFHDY